MTDPHIIEPGCRVTWNERGEELFGKTTATALVVAIGAEKAHLLWSTGQETFASISCLTRVTEAALRLRNAIADVLVNSAHYPPKVGVRMLGEDMAPLIDKVTAAVEAALNHEKGGQ